MSRHLVLRSVARREFDAAVDWYEQQRSGLGREFLSEVDRLLEIIRKQPQRIAVVHADIREALVRRFPFAVYFRDEGEQTIILAVFHAARDPELWRSRS